RTGGTCPDRRSSRRPPGSQGRPEPAGRPCPHGATGCARAPGPPAAYRSDSRASGFRSLTPAVLPGSTQRGQSLLVIGDVTRLRRRVDHLPADYAVLVDDERAAYRDAPVFVEHAVPPGHVAVRPEVRQQPELEALPVRPHPAPVAQLH